MLGASITFGKGLNEAAPGYAIGGLVVPDIRAAHDGLIGFPHLKRIVCFRTSKPRASLTRCHIASAANGSPPRTAWAYLHRHEVAF